MEQSNEKLTGFTSNLKYKISARVPDTMIMVNRALTS